MAGPAVDTPIGSAAVSPSGQFNYRYPLELPPGIGYANEPKLSLNYSQSNIPGLLGVGWSLGGLSTITRTEPSIIEKLQPGSPSSFPYRFSLEGQQLFNIEGNYGDDDTKYKTEIDNGETVQAQKGGGFKVTTKIGRTRKYGCSPDSRVLCPDNSTIATWLLEEDKDIMGNYISYAYRTMPAIRRPGDGGIINPNPGIEILTAMPKKITWTSNENTGYKGRFVANFSYVKRTETLIVTGIGGTNAIGERLDRIQIAYKDGTLEKQIRAYVLTYQQSLQTGFSQITEIRVEGISTGGAAPDLKPTSFTYSAPLNSGSAAFQPLSSSAFDFPGSNSNKMVLAANISGRGLSDVVIVQQSQTGQQLVVNTFLAQKDETSHTVSWPWSSKKLAQLNIPWIQDDVHYLMGSITGDGRSDLVVPYTLRASGATQDKLRLAILKATDSGLNDAINFLTDYDSLYKNSQFLLTDLEGDGRIDLVQIHGVGGKLNFRAFYTASHLYYKQAVDKNNVVETSTTESWGSTISWTPIHMKRTGQTALLRLHWAVKDPAKPNYRPILRASTWAPEGAAFSRGQFKMLSAIDLGIYEYQTVADRPLIDAFCCDINGDGIQDIVTCQRNNKDVTNRSITIDFVFKTFLSDGQGGFLPALEKTITKSDLPRQEDPKFNVTSMDGSPVPCIFYTFRTSIARGFDGRLQGLCFCGSTDGVVQDPTLYNLDSADSDIGGESWIDLQPADLCGTGQGGWLAIKSIKKSVNTTGWKVTPIFNKCPRADQLLTVVDPLGMLTSLRYMPLTSDQVYTASQLQEPPGADFTHIRASRTHVVSQLTVSSQSGGFNYFQKKLFHYTDAHFSLTGRGWLGFANVRATDPIRNTSKSEDYIQAWPLTGHLKLSTIQQDATTWESSEMLYETPFVSVKNQNVSIMRVDRSMEVIEDCGKRRMSTTWRYDANGNMYEEDVVTEATQDDIGSKVYVLSVYTTVNGNPHYLSRKKVTTNLNASPSLDQFNDGDLKLSKYEYATSGPTAGKMICMNEWSTSTHTFIPKRLEYDAYGNITKTTASGLITETEFDSEFHTYLVKTSISPETPLPSSDYAFSVVEYTAFDARFGAKIATLDTVQTLTTTELDLFGRKMLTSKSAIDDDQGLGASEAWKHVDFALCAIHPKFATDIRTTLYVVPYEGTMYVSVGSNKLQAYSRRSWRHFGYSDRQEYSDEIIDCIGKTRLSMTWLPDNSPLVCQYFEYNDQGQVTKAMMPRYFNKYEDALDLIPVDEECNITEYDAFGRPTTHQKAASKVVTRCEYHDQGSTIVTRTGTQGPQGFAELETTTAKYQYYAGERKLTQISDYDGQLKKMTYDALGRMTSMVNAVGLSKENWEYDSFDNITSHTIHGLYTVSRQYDDRNCMIKETKTGTKGTIETTQYTYDALGRMRVRVDFDGRTSYYSYPTSEIQSILLKESKTEGGRFKTTTSFVYDKRARLGSKQTRIDDTDSNAAVYMRSTDEGYKYDWQNRLLQKTFPDFGTLTRKYNGTRLESIDRDYKYSTKCQVHFNEYTAGGKPMKWTVSTSVETWTLTFQRSYDIHDYLVESSVTHSKNGLLKHLIYQYNGLDKLERIRDDVKKETTLYQYSQSRLSTKSTQKDGDPNPLITNFKHNENGDLLDKGHASFDINSDDIVASDGQKDLVRVTYDDMGRMRTREDHVRGASFRVNKYDGFFKMSELENQTTHQISYFVTDAQGQNLARIESARRSTMYLGDDWEEETDRNTGCATSRCRLTVVGIPIAIFFCTIKSADLVGKSLMLCITNHKGSVTDIMSATSSASEEIISDDFGLTTLKNKTSPAEFMAYEGKSLDMNAGLINFRGRWYDPYFGRFTTPDDLDFLPTALLKGGMNRRAFELNDPVNHIDPSGHITRDAWIAFGVSAGATAIGLIIGIATTGGVGFVAVLGWGLTGGGIAGMTYSIHHRDASGGTFWKGFAWNVGIGATVGIISGAAGVYIEDTEFAVTVMQKSQKFISEAAARALLQEEFVAYGATVTSQALINSGKSVLTTFLDNLGETWYYPEEHTSLSEGLLLAAGVGAITAGLGSSAKWGWKYRGVRTRFNTDLVIPAKFRAKVVVTRVKNVYKDARGQPLSREPRLSTMIDEFREMDYSRSISTTQLRLFGFSSHQGDDIFSGYGTF